MVQALRRRRSWPVDGYLIACPYYTRPSQQGMVRHFTAVAESTGRPILLYNIPYRTGVNLGNDAMLALARLPNIVGVKDCCADQAQSIDLLLRRPAGFSVLTGEDARSTSRPRREAEGAIAAAAHIHTGAFAVVHKAAGGRPGGGAGGVARAGRSAAPAVRRTEPGADQALAVARRGKKAGS